MSGGHWQYRQYDIERWAGIFAEWDDLLSEFEHVLDWGISADTSEDEARRAVQEAVVAFLDFHFGDGTIRAVDVLHGAKV